MQTHASHPSTWEARIKAILGFIVSLGSSWDTDEDAILYKTSKQQ